MEFKTELESDRYRSIKRFAEQAGGLLVVGHGTRARMGQEQLLELTALMTKLCPNVPIEASFLELAEPDIATAVNSLALRNVRNVFTIPILLFEAAHAREDIPNAVQSAIECSGLNLTGQSQSLNDHSASLGLSLLRSVQALLCCNTLGCNRAAFCERAADCLPKGALDRSDSLLYLLRKACQTQSVDALDDPLLNQLFDKLSRTALVMIGRGTSEIAARQTMHRFVRKRCDIGPVASLDVGFFAGDPVTVEIALESAANRTESDTILVQPHLLFEGQLTEQLRNAIDAMRIKYPLKRWLCAMPLGGDQSLAETYLSLAEEALQSADVS